MKHLFLFFFLFANTFCFSQQVFDYRMDSLVLSTPGHYECKEKTVYSEWSLVDTAKNESLVCQTSIFGHQWVYAEKGDVNQVDYYNSCGRSITTLLSSVDTSTEIEARICKTCKLHQKRIKTITYEWVKRESEYLKLAKQKKSNTQ